MMNGWRFTSEATGNGSKSKKFISNRKYQALLGFKKAPWS
jgi:hypothetical protein